MNVSGEEGGMFSKKSFIKKVFQEDVKHGYVTYFDKGDNDAEDKEIRRERKRYIKRLEPKI